MNKEQLSQIIIKSEDKIERLKSIGYAELKEKLTEIESVFKEFKEGGEALLAEDSTLQIGIVGQVKAGKSSFLNSLFFDGEDVLPKASTPMTAGLTIIEYAEKNTFEVEYFNEKDWRIFEKQDEDYRKQEADIRKQHPDAPETIINREIKNRISERIRSAHEMVEKCDSAARSKIGSKNDVKGFSGLKDLQDVLEQYVGAEGRYTSVVKSLYIKMNEDKLKGIRIVDTPGVNDPVVSRENRTRTFLHSCHGVFLLSSSTDFLGSGDVSFLNARIGGSGIGRVVLLASKFDSVLQDIGAEREMKGEERGDLVDTVEMQKEKFKRRKRELDDTIDEKLRDRIKIDTTAGIGYSIAKKPSEKWSDIERQVVTQMKRYYPNYFSTDEEVKEYFLGLANIKAIKEDYLEGEFMSNKDSIIAEKVNGFFDTNKKEVRSTIENVLSEMKNRREILNETSVKEIQRQKEEQGNVFSDLKDHFEGILNRFGSSIQSKIKSLSNDLPFNEVRDIPTEKEPISVRYKLGFWHATDDVAIDQVNVYALKTEVGNAVKSYAGSWNAEWKQLFSNARENMINELTEAISECEKKMMSRSFNDMYYRNLIDKTLDGLQSYKELAISETITEFTRQGDDRADNPFVFSSEDEWEEEEAKKKLEEQLRKHKKSLIETFRNLADGIKADVTKEVNKNLEGALVIINEMRTSFSEKLTEEGNLYLKRLEEELKDKSDVLDKVDDSIKCLKELSTIYE